MNIQYLGHSCFLVSVSDKKLLFDPFISPNPLAKAIDIDQISPHYILVSHGHEDHMADVDHIAKSSGACIVSNFEITSWFQKKGIQNVHPMNIGGAWSFDFGKVYMTPAIHSSSLPDGSYGGNPGGFVIETIDKTIYFAGDTALFSDLTLIGKKHSLDWCFLPIGDNFTMGYEDASTAAQWLNCKKVIGMHYDTFGYIQVDHAKAFSEFEKKGVLLQLLNIGSSISI